jgi:putative glutamine amidotransferase
MTRPRRATPLIGITPDTIETTSRSAAPEPAIVLTGRYARAVERAGAVPLVLPIASSRAAVRRAIDHLDGIIVSGGDFDIHPKFYGEKPIRALGCVKEERTEFELGLISLALARDMPLLGICGGAQAINVALGGSLYQDIAADFCGAVEHQRGALKDRGGHKVEIPSGTKLRRIVGRSTIEVNTTHHQAVKQTGKGLIVDATAEDGVIEGIESEEHSFVLGVQWHPEFLVHRDRAQRQIFAAFVAACRA